MTLFWSWLITTFFLNLVWDAAFHLDRIPSWWRRFWIRWALDAPIQFAVWLILFSQTGKVLG